MEFNDVLKEFMAISKLGESECADYHNLVITSISEVERKLKVGVDLEENKVILTQLCVAIAYYRYNVLANTQNSDINIADLKVSVNSSKEIASARLYKNEIMAMASDLLKDDNFVFGVMN